MGRHGFKGLKVYQVAYKLALDIFQATKDFPLEERYSLTDQIRRSSRSVVANIAEAFRKRRYAGVFIQKLSDADGETNETLVWLDIARDCDYLTVERHGVLVQAYEEIGRMLGSMLARSEKFTHST